MKEKKELAKFLINTLNGIDASLNTTRTLVAPYSFMQSEVDEIKIKAKNDLQKFENIMDSFIDTFLDNEIKLGEWVEKYKTDFLDINSLCSKTLIKAYFQDFKVETIEVL